MRIYFLRHTEAEDGPVDAERELTGRGRRDAEAVGRFLRDVGVLPDRVYTSPLVRAVQTASRLLKHRPLRRRSDLAVAEALLNDTSAAAFQRWLLSLPDVETILLVGHEPSLSLRVRTLVGLTRPGSLPLPKGGLVRVDTEDRRRGALRLVTSPKQIP